MVGTLEEFVERSRQQADAREFNSLDRTMMGTRTSRIEVPTTDRDSLRRLPDVFRDLAGFIEHHANNPNYDDRTVVLTIQDYIASTVRPRIKAIHGTERFNSNGTVRVKRGVS